MKKIYANNFKTLDLGRQGENLAWQVVFDVRDLESLYGPGDVEVIYQRPGDAQPYPLAVQRDGTLVTWDVTATDTEMSDGYGKCELRYYVGETLAKSQIWRTWVEPALPTPSETAPPEPEQGWVDQVLAVGVSVKEATDSVKAYANSAEQSASGSAQSAQEAAGSASTASTSETNAKASEESAKASETAAQASQTAAAGSASSAANSATSASAAASAASESASAAAASETAAKASEEAAKASETAAKASETAAAESASAAQQSATSAAESAAVYDDVVADVNQLKQDLYDLAPAGAAIGQLFRVAAVSEDGKYTMEPVDMPRGSVEDVTSKGVSIVKNGVAIIPAATTNGVAGVIGVASVYGLNVSTSTNLRATAITEASYHTQDNQMFIGKGTLENVKYLLLKNAMCDGKGPAWTAEEQAAACNRVGAIRSYGDGWILKARWQNSDPITVDFSGCSEFFIAGYINAIGESDLLTNIDSNKICYQFVKNGERNVRILFCNQPIGGIMPLLGKWSSYAGIQGDNLTVYNIGKIGSTKKISDITTFSMSKPEVVTSMDIYVYAR